MKTMSGTHQTFNWIFGLLFVTIGVLNLLLVHPVPGFFYIVLSIIYLPPIYAVLSQKAGFTINNILKIILALLILWGTLAVGDLMELFESWMLGT